MLVMDKSEWIVVPKRLTFGMRVALEIAVERHADDVDRVWSEVLDFAPSPIRKDEQSAL